ASLSTQSMGMPILGKQDRETVLQFMLGVAAIYNRKFIDWQAQVSKQDTGISIWFRAIVNARNMHEYLAKQKAKGRHVWYNLEGYCWLAFKRQKKVVGTVQDYNMKCDNLMSHSMWAGDNREWKNNELRKVFFNGNKKMDAAPFFQGIRIIRNLIEDFFLFFTEDHSSRIEYAAIFFNLLNNRATSGAVNGFTEYKEEADHMVCGARDAVPGIKEKELGGIFHLETSISIDWLSYAVLAGVRNLLDADYPSLDQIQFNKEQENFILKSVNLGFLHPLVL
ncbi:hypothetical protein ACJX0J_001925, partial (mitochondrion) [Zea mays]